MPYQLDWLIKDAVSYAFVKGELTLSDLLNISKDRSKLIAQSANKTVHHIADFRLVESFPQNLKEIRQHTPHLANPKTGCVMLLYDNVMVPYLASITARLAGADFKSFREPEALFKFLKVLEPNTDSPLEAYQLLFADFQNH